MPLVLLVVFVVTIAMSATTNSDMAKARAIGLRILSQIFIRAMPNKLKLSDPAHEGVRLQPGRDGRVRCSEWLAASNTDSNLISSPHPYEADWYVSICRPAWLHLHPAIIDDLFVQFGHLPAGRERRFRVVGQQVHVRLDCDRLAIGCLEVRRHPCCDNEKRMKSNKHIRRTTPGKPRCFRVQRRKLGEMLINQARRDQIVTRRWESGRGNIRQAEGLEHAPCASLTQHLGRGIHPIDRFYALARQPCGSAPRSATEIRAALDGTPGDALDLAEQPQIHITLYGVLVGRGPLSVTFTRRHGAVLASIKCSEVRHIKLVPTCSWRLTTQAQRPGPRGRSLATATRRRRSLRRIG